MRIAAAPISWGVCEAPGWGYQLSPGRVLAEMRALGIIATEYGPDGFLPADPDRRAALLNGHRLRGIGGFVPLVLHEGDPLPAATRQIRAIAAAGGELLVLGAASGAAGYDDGGEIDASGWRTLLGRLDAIAALAADHGLTAVLHPHVGTAVETGEQVARVLDGSAIDLCLDTGHLLVGGTDPVTFAARHTDRIAHVHLKDVAAPLADRVRGRTLPYSAAVRAGLFRPLGAGDIDLAALLAALRAGGYRGWYVLEQDVMLEAEPDGSGPASDVRASLDYLAGSS